MCVTQAVTEGAYQAVRAMNKSDYRVGMISNDENSPEAASH